MNVSWLWGQAHVNFHSAPSTVALIKKEGSETSLLEVCKEAAPPCRLSPLLCNGHLQTIWTTVKTAEAAVYYRRKVFEAEDSEYPGSFAVDFVVDQCETEKGLPPRTSYCNEDLGSSDHSPMLVVLHGLSGGSYELYLRQAILPLLTTTESQSSGWQICVVNARGCANSQLTSSVLFNARATWDVRQVVKWLRARFPNRPLYGMGFSLGANILTNYLAEEGSASLIKAAVVISNPWNLDVGSVGLQRTWIGLHVYSRAMGTNVRRLFELHESEISKNPEINAEKVKKVTFLHEFDREVQCPSWGYPTEGAYYRDASSIDMLNDVRVPLLAINAEDDPIVPRECLPYIESRHNPYVVLCTTSIGGHIGWFESGGGRWYAKTGSAFLRKMAAGLAPRESTESELEPFSQRLVASHTSFRPCRRRLQSEDAKPGASL